MIYILLIDSFHCGISVILFSKKASLLKSVREYEISNREYSELRESGEVETSKAIFRIIIVKKENIK